MKCPNCRKDIKDEDAAYCPYCSKSLKELPPKKTSFPIAGGILAINAACASIVIGTIYTGGFISSLSYRWTLRYDILSAGIFGIIAFAFGLAGGIMSIRRKMFAVSIVGVCFVLVGGFVDILALAFEGHGAWIGGFVLSLPIIVLSVLSLIFIAVSIREFS